MWLKHPAVVREELLEAQAHGEDEHEPQHGAEDHCWQQHLALGTQGLAGKDGWGQLDALRVKRETLKESVCTVQKASLTHIMNISAS